MAEQVVVPLPIIIKDEVLSDGEEVYCRLCHKAFLSDIALRNHARMDHIEAYENGDPTVWTKSPDDPIVKSRSAKKLQKIILKKNQTLSSISSTSINSFAPNNVSYIIIKAEDAPTDGTRKKVGKKEKEEKKVVVPKRAKSPQAITGPFECVDASSTGADGACHQIFFSCCEYSQHARLEHSRRRRTARCQVCERPLPAPNATMDPDKPYACETCGEAYATADELQTHTSKAHVKLKPYACNVCQKRFTQQGGVLQHMRMHSGDRPFHCTFCDKQFTQKSGLDQHTRTHTKVKPYRCVVCGKAFIQSVHLKQHMRTHTNLTPFQCGICDKRFKQSSHLNYHLKNHTPGTMTETQLEKYKALVGKMCQEQAEMDERRKKLEQRSRAAHADLTYEQGNVEEEYVDQDDVEGYIEQEEVEQMESDTYDGDPRDVCTVEQVNSQYLSENDTYEIII